MTIETIFFGHDNKRTLDKPSELVRGARVEVGREVRCPRCGTWTPFEGQSHGVLKQCAGNCGLYYGTMGTAIRMTDDPDEAHRASWDHA